MSRKPEAARHYSRSKWLGLGLALCALAITPAAAESAAARAARSLAHAESARKVLTAKAASIDIARDAANQKLLGLAADLARGAAQAQVAHQAIGDLEGEAARLKTELASDRDRLTSALAGLIALGRPKARFELLSRRGRAERAVALSLLSRAAGSLAARAQQSRSRLAALDRIGAKLAQAHDQLARTETDLLSAQTATNARLAALNAEAGEVAAEIAAFDAAIHASREALRAAKQRPAPVNGRASRMERRPPPPPANSAPSDPGLSDPAPAIRLRAPGPLTLTFGARDGANSARGVGFDVRKGATVTAPAAGAVEYAERLKDYGPVVILDLGQGYRLTIIGLTNLLVAPGAQIGEGAPLGVAARDGPANLRMELWHYGRPIDPSPAFRRR